jgi:hypothetical protein
MQPLRAATASYPRADQEGIAAVQVGAGPNLDRSMERVEHGLAYRKCDETTCLLRDAGDVGGPVFG